LHAVGASGGVPYHADPVAQRQVAGGNASDIGPIARVGFDASRGIRFDELGVEFLAEAVEIAQVARQVLRNVVVGLAGGIRVAMEHVDKHVGQCARVGGSSAWIGSPADQVVGAAWRGWRSWGLAGAGRRRRAIAQHIAGISYGRASPCG